ncbi:MAG: Hydroxymethylpyrimidine transporter, transrane component [Subtercola sp.]|nr:Hydroxymethylpyrimidine transporter, transrane component [Subtercola sp.]
MSEQLTRPSSEELDATGLLSPGHAVIGEGPAVRRRFRVPDWVYTTLIVVGLLVLGQLAVDHGWVSKLMVASPTSVWVELKQGFSNGIYLHAINRTLVSTLVGFVIAAVAGNLLAVLMAMSGRFEGIIFPLVVAFQSLPKVAIAPLIVIWVGFGISSQILVVVLVAIFPVLVNSLQGLRLRDREQYELSKSLGASAWQIARWVRFPASLPYVFAGLRLAAVFSLLGAITAEFVGSSEGLGVLMLQQRASLNVPGTFATLLVLMVFGVALNEIMSFIERRVVYWSREVTTLNV